MPTLIRTNVRRTQEARKPVEAQVAKIRDLPIEQLRERIAASRALSAEELAQKQATDIRARAEQAAGRIRDI
ncbi:hypothetical protein [Leifsonia sp. 21MFCrub1.1]|uniref:hypothetical protein n=1 Tax=Leifsonia sp. 21MFCrub1.1 TaxID=1798223 RepID=UPI0012FE2E35|nr:hypothetical protein [Leifsonia sp. 21MFCrub1.1]